MNTPGVNDLEDIFLRGETFVFEKIIIFLIYQLSGLASPLL